jgi:outer membrane cobalamin receptor
MVAYVHQKLTVFTAFVLFFISLSSLSFIQTIAQTGSVKGNISDASTGEALIGASILIQGTTKGTITDLDGNFHLDNLENGNYNLVIGYVSYEQQIQRITINPGESVELNIQLQTTSTELGLVKVVASKRSDTDMSMITALKSSSLSASGITRQQISRSQDRDASEVVTRVPGVTVRDGKFINVRGLDERYNVVWLNGTSTPSSEADRRAFSFDVLPSSLIDNIFLYKTAAPEIPADFAGAVVQIQTKSTVDNNSTDISYSAGYRQFTTFRDMYSYTGGKHDWIGFDDGTRSIPKGFPSTSEFRDLTDNPTEADKQAITDMGRSFNKIWTPYKTNAIPDQAFQLNLNRKFLLGKVSIGNVTSLGYSVGNQYREIFRAGYQVYDQVNDHPDTSYYFYDDHYLTKTKLNGLFNWLFVFGQNQKIEFRNFFNQISDKHTLLRTGRDFYGGSYKAASELGFQSRSIYSGQLTGTLNYRSSAIKLDWTLGYSYTNKMLPDIRRIEKNRNEDDGPNAPYVTSLNFNADPKLLGRLTLTNHENVYVGGLNYLHKIEIGNFIPELKAGFLAEFKNRTFTARNIGFAYGNVSQFNWDLIYQPIDTLFLDKNINFTDGIKVDESTNLSDSYDASNALYAGYVGINLPFRKLKVYGGVRAEKNRQILDGFDQNSNPVKVDNNYFDFFPSVNMSYNITERTLLRGAYGRTINRPEFREIAPFVFYNFEEKATYYGNPALTNSYINSIELRYEYFPSVGDMITFGGFFKHFETPIEAHLIEGGSGLNYNYSNARSAGSYGLEIDLRKSLINLENSSSFLRSFRHFVLVFNAAIIRSELRTDDPNERESIRRMQGQAPYIVNTALFYDNPDIGLMVSVQYNIIGERIAYVGNKSNPHMYQIPRNLLDVTFNKQIGKHIVLKGGIKDIFNQPIELNQNEYVQVVPNDPDSQSKRIQKNMVYKPSTAFTLGFTLIF